MSLLRPIRTFQKKVTTLNQTPPAAAVAASSTSSATTMVNISKRRADGGKTTTESKNVVFIETSPNLLPATRLLSSQQGLESPSYDFSDDTLDDNYVSHDDMLRDVQNYTSALDFGADMFVGTVELLLSQQASAGVTLPGRASPAVVSPGGSYTGGIITSTSAYTCFCGTMGNSRAAEPQTFCLCLSLHVTGETATATEHMEKGWVPTATESRLLDKDPGEGNDGMEEPPDTLGVHLSTPQREVKVSSTRRRSTTVL